MQPLIFGSVAVLIAVCLITALTGALLSIAVLESIADARFDKALS